jgi:hypothetical protein
MTTIGICGDDCLYCPRYLATQRGKVEELEKVKDLWVRLGFRNPACYASDLTCYGCTPENNCAYRELRACVYERGIENCGLCEVYPCQFVRAVFEKSDQLCSQALKVCTTKEMELLRKAFFSKRENLEKMHLEKHKKTKTRKARQPAAS